MNIAFVFISLVHSDRVPLSSVLALHTRARNLCVRVCVCFLFRGICWFFGCVAGFALADVAVIVGVAVCFTLNMDVWKWV